MISRSFFREVNDRMMQKSGIHTSFAVKTDGFVSKDKPQTLSTLQTFINPIEDKEFNHEYPERLLK
jgi:hypothetical protein